MAPELFDAGVGSELLEMAIKDALAKGAVGIKTSTPSPDARRLYERHHFRQLMGSWRMSEIFLQLDMEEYGQGRKSKRNSIRQGGNMPPENNLSTDRTDPRDPS